MRRILHALGLELMTLSFSGCAQPKNAIEATFHSSDNVLAGKVLDIHPVAVVYRQREHGKNHSMENKYQFFYVYLSGQNGEIRTVVYPTRPKLKKGQHVTLSIQPFSNTKEAMRVSDLVDRLSSGVYQSDDHTHLYGEGIAASQ